MTIAKMWVCGCVGGGGGGVGGGGGPGMIRIIRVGMENCNFNLI